MAAGNAMIEFRIVQTKAPNGQVIGERWQVRTKAVIAIVLGGLPIGDTWSPWQDINTEIVIEQT